MYNHILKRKLRGKEKRTKGKGKEKREGRRKDRTICISL